MLFYPVFIALFAVGVRIAGLFSSKARAWVEGRRNWAQQLEKELAGNTAPLIWMHCASAGEFEQGKPVLEALRLQFPGHLILVSFFSPSGFGVGKKYKGADHIVYLPLDTARNARRFLALTKPSLVIFIKYDYWYRHLRAVYEAGIPLLMVSAIFRRQQAFFRWYGGLHRRMLTYFTWLFVQDEASVDLLKTIGITRASANGDTRFDRVATITEAPAPLPLIEAFVQGEGPVLVAGSTWTEDEQVLAGLSSHVRMIIAPHEISTANITRLRELFPGEAVTYSALQAGGAGPAARVLLIDNIGMLSRLYRYGHVTYIGGGYNKSGIHNTLEAAAWGKPVYFGPNYQKFREAVGLIEAGAAESVNNAEKLQQRIDSLYEHPEHGAQVGEAAARYVRENIGATGRVVAFIQEKRLLTS
ncbi:3-deoxy-D-manno-octulosonic acid transferase [Flaviaesturariibacter amylovorans]|uniref:3-deoxy-D-manno-octulosonic acid transferase n=1 Tax=Flaviaesturariibacter amylovorans TaxID=1084520 RepID=A0ABP8GKD6_9BACT